MKAANATSAAKAAKGPEEAPEEEEVEKRGEEEVVAEEERDVQEVEGGGREAVEVEVAEEDEGAAPRKKRKVGLSLRSPALGWSDILMEPVAVADFEVDERYTPGRGLHSSTFRLNVTHFFVKYAGWRQTVSEVPTHGSG